MRVMYTSDGVAGGGGGGGSGGGGDEGRDLNSSVVSAPTSVWGKPFQS